MEIEGVVDLTNVEGTGRYVPSVSLCAGEQRNEQEKLYKQSTGLFHDF